MSVKAMAWVWDQDIPRDEKFILLAYADHADHEGNSIYPAVDTIAKKTGYSRRSVQRITQKLVDNGWLNEEGKSHRQTNQYRIPIYGGDKMTPPTDRGAKIDKEGVPFATRGVPNGTQRGDTAVASKPSLTINKEPSEEPLETAVAISSFHDHLRPKLNTIYANITGQTSIIYKYSDEAFINLEAIYAACNDDAGAVIEKCKPHFQEWCTKIGKNGRPYSKTNPGWLSWVLEELAPSPAKAVPIEIPRPHVMCAQGEQLRKKVEQYPDSYLNNFKDHINECHICGGASNAPQVQEDIKQLAQRMGVK